MEYLHKIMYVPIKLAACNEKINRNTYTRSAICQKQVYLDCTCITMLLLGTALPSEASYPSSPHYLWWRFHAAPQPAVQMQVPQVTHPDSSSACKAVKMWPTAISSP